MIVQRDLFGARQGEYEVPSVSTPMPCRSCGASIVWTMTLKGKAMPLSAATIEERNDLRYALPHFVDCPQAKDWSKK
jgi:hypothetical protein